MIVTILYTVECIEFISIKIKSSEIYLYFRDHNGLILTIRVTKKPKGKGFSKFNTSIIKHECFKASFAKFLKNWQQEQYRYKSVNLWWEAGKICFKMFGIEFSTIRNQNINKQHQKLTQAILNEKMKENQDQNKIH